MVAWVLSLLNAHVNNFRLDLFFVNPYQTNTWTCELPTAELAYIKTLNNRNTSMRSTHCWINVWNKLPQQSTLTYDKPLFLWVVEYFKVRIVEKTHDCFWVGGFTHEWLKNQLVLFIVGQPKARIVKNETMVILFFVSWAHRWCTANAGAGPHLWTLIHFIFWFLYEPKVVNNC